METVTVTLFAFLFGLGNFNALDSLGNDLQTVRPGQGFVWEQIGNDVFLKFTAVPEPASLGGMLVLFGSWVLRRRNKRAAVTA